MQSTLIDCTTLFLLLETLISSGFLHTNTFPQTAINFYGWIALSQMLAMSYYFYKGVLSDT